MTRDELIKEIFKLSVEDREFLVHEIWASIGIDMEYFYDIEKQVDKDTHTLREEAEYKNDPMFKFWKGVNEKLSDGPDELSQEVKGMLDERMAAVENGTAVMYDWLELKSKYDKLVKK